MHVRDRNLLELVSPTGCPGDKWFAMVPYLAGACACVSLSTSCCLSSLSQASYVAGSPCPWRGWTRTQGLLLSHAPSAQNATSCCYVATRVELFTDCGEILPTPDTRFAFGHFPAPLLARDVDRYK